jgi:hypothetical protein
VHTVELVGILSVFYCDWVIDGIAVNLTGACAPSGDITVVYWLYIVAKGLPLFSF